MTEENEDENDDKSNPHLGLVPAAGYAWQVDQNFASCICSRKYSVFFFVTIKFKSCRCCY